MIQRCPLFINGEFKDSVNANQIINPATSEIIAEVAVAGEDDVNLAIASARNCYDKVWSKVSLKERREFLIKICLGIMDKASELAKLETLNTGKPIKESTFMDIPTSAKTFEYFANNLEEYLNEQELALDNAEGRLVRSGRGVVVLIVPWNYPLIIASWKMAQALAAGNSVILKPSSLTPLTALELGKIIQESGLPAGTVNIITGSGESIGEALCSGKNVDMISFTGSNSVGKKIIEYCSGNVKKLIMELGGKSAGIVLKDADFETAVNGCLCSIFLNQGQMCTAMSRILVEDDIYDKFIEDFVNKAKRINIGNGLDYQTQMGPLISKQQRDSVMGFVERAKKQGAKLVCGGKVPDSSELKKGFFFEPTIFTQVPIDAEIFKEEIFAPVACVNKFSSIDEAIEIANKSDFALAGAIWTKDIPRAEKIAFCINAGTVWINTYGMFYNELPYGGFKQSGFGKELGREGFLEYTLLKNIITDKSPDSKPLVNYWYGF